MLLVLILVVGVIGGSDGTSDGFRVVLSPLQGSEQFVCESVQEVREGAVDLDVGTPDSILRGRFDSGVPLRVAGEPMAVEPMAEGVTSASGFSGHIAYEQSETLLEAPSERGLDGQVFYISIYCCIGDSTGTYCGQTASGVLVAPWVAACSSHHSLGTHFLIAETWGVVCLDRGGAVSRSNHLDVWFYDCGIQEDPAPDTGWEWLQATGTRVMVEVLDGQ